MPSLPVTLTYLDFSVNSLWNTANFPSGLVYINLAENVILTLPPLPNTLRHIECWDNFLDSLPILPDSLTYLSCWGNSITQLPALPATLQYLEAEQNQLTALPNLPPTLAFLACDNNWQLSALPSLPPTLTVLYCGYTIISELPPLPHSITTLDCTLDTNLYCLPYVYQDTLDVFNITNTKIQCLPNHFSARTYDTDPDTMQICGLASGCPLYIMPDSLVWPGDADANHIVDNNDLLPIGLGYDTTGHTRSTQGIIWQGDIAIDWADSFSNYIYPLNYKHADCNGDGVIDANDTLAIVQNFSLTHAKTNGLSSPWRSGIAGLYAIPSIDTLNNSSILTINFILGDSAIPVNNFYAIAFTYNFDPLIVDTNYINISFGNSWIGTNDKISINKIFNNSGQIKAAVTRIDHTTRSGNGIIASATYKINTQNVANGSLYYYTNIGNISNVTAIDQFGNVIPINTGADTTQIAVAPLGISLLNNVSSIHLYPNPNTGSFTLQTSNSIGSDYTISDMLGHIIMQRSIRSDNEVISLSDAAEGVYTLTVKGAQPIRFVVVR
jgi:hypothetical protein